MELPRGFAIENEWYWKLTEGARTFDAVSAVRDFLAPLARHGKDRLAITDIACEVDEVRFAIGETTYSIRIYAGETDRVAVNHFISDIDRALHAAGTDLVFALIVPRRYELRGVLVTEEELHALAGDPALLLPTSRASWRSLVG